MGMFLLPKGIPVLSGLPAARNPGPEFFGRLARERFTGYASYSFPSSLAVFLFEGGKLISAMMSRGGTRFTGFEAVTATFQHVATEGGTIDVFRLSADLIMCLHALLHGEILSKGQELKLIDAKALVTKMKSQRLNGCLRIYTAERTALIFYKEGMPLGFFHDGSESIETSASESQRIAGLPGAKVDVLATKSAEQLQAFDLLEMVNVDKVWESTQRAHSAQLERLKQQADEEDRKHREAKLGILEESLRAVATRCVGKMGRTLVDKELGDRGGRSCLLEAARTSDFLSGVEKGARLLAGASKVKEMLGQMRAEIAQKFG